MGETLIPWGSAQDRRPCKTHKGSRDECWMFDEQQLYPEPKVFPTWPGLAAEAVQRAESHSGYTFPEHTHSADYNLHFGGTGHRGSENYTARAMYDMARIFANSLGIAMNGPDDSGKFAIDIETYGFYPENVKDLTAEKMMKSLAPTRITAPVIDYKMIEERLEAYVSLSSIRPPQHNKFHIQTAETVPLNREEHHGA